MPVTHISFLIACLAIAGIPPFSGFFSKEEILLAAYHSNKLVYTIAVLTSALTAFYMFRLYYSIFWSKESTVHDRSHGEGTASMKIVLIILGILRFCAGFVPLSSLVTSDGVPLESHIDIAFSACRFCWRSAGIGLATYLYKTENDRPQSHCHITGQFIKPAYHKFYIDEIYLFITKKIIFNLDWPTCSLD